MNNMLVDAKSLADIPWTIWEKLKIVNVIDVITIFNILKFFMRILDWGLPWLQDKMDQN